MLNGKVAIVTGSSRGIGSGIALEFAKAGANVVVCYFNDKDKGEIIYNQILKMGRKALLVEYILGDEESNKALLNTAINHFGKVDILVNNAATHHESDYLKFTAEEIRAEINRVLISQMLLTQEIIPHFQKNKGGIIVNLASVGGQWGGQYAIPYACAKAGIINFTRSIAKTFGKDNIRCNAISPGLILTDASKREIESEVGKTKLKLIPLAKFGDIQDAGKLALFLASDMSSYITGQTINLNGGMYMG